MDLTLVTSYTCSPELWIRFDFICPVFLSIPMYQRGTVMFLALLMLIVILGDIASFV